MSKINLNPEQKRAVQHPRGPLLIIAGAGTGKTTVITERIKWLIETGKAQPEEILALTFTERAAREMEERVDIALPLGYTQTWILTFHAFGEQTLRQEAVQIGLDPDFKVMSEAESYLFLKEHLFEFELDYFRPKGNPLKFIRGLLTHFSRLKDDDISPKEYLKFANSKASTSKPQPQTRQEQKKLIELAKAYATYEALKIRHSRMDFADLISNTLKLFRQRPNILRLYQDKFKYILVDEFQDTNYAQNHLLILLAGKRKNITAVADDDQSIYRWRGAAVYNVLDFKKHFPETKIVVLTQNYRSQQYILDHAYRLIQQNNPNRLEVTEKINKKLISQLPVNPDLPQTPQLILTEHGEDEAELVVREIQKLHQAKSFNYAYKDFAILIRANAHASLFTRALEYNAIPYQFLGSGRLFRRPEIRDLIAYLKILARFDNDEAMYRVLTSPSFKFSGRQLAALINHAHRHSQTLFESMEQIPTYRQLVKLIHHHLELIPHATSGQILYHYLQETGQLQQLKDPQSESDLRRAQNIAQFFKEIQEYEILNPQAHVHDFVEYLDFLISTGESPRVNETDWFEENAVNILTVHSAKGLEFPVVFMVNLVDQRFPSRNRSDQIPVPEEIIKEPSFSGNLHEQEERRLFYVGMTRAKQHLYLSAAKHYPGNKRPQKPSPFIWEALGKSRKEDLLKNQNPKEQQTTFLEYLHPIQKEPPSPSPLPPKDLPTPHKVNYLSYSRIADFQICPLHYQLKYILKLPTPPSAARSYGDTIHHTLRDFYRQEQRSLSALLELYDQHWSPLGFKNKAHAKEAYLKGKKQLEKFYQQENWEKIKTIAVEQPFTIKLTNNLKIGGRIDRVDRLEDGTLEIIDYKTGQIQDEKDLQRGLQLAIYALAAHHPRVYNQPLDKLRVKYYYFDSGEWVELKYSPKELARAKEEILKIRQEIENSNFQCSRHFLCQKGCEFSLFCLEEEL